MFISIGAGRNGVDTPPSCPSTPGGHGKGLLQPGQARVPMFITVKHFNSFFSKIGNNYHIYFTLFDIINIKTTH